jgi:hypothetical protein
MGDVGEFWRDVKEHQKKAKNARWEQNRKQLYELLEKDVFNCALENEGTGHVVINDDIDFFLSTGTWLVRGKRKRGHGFKQLLHYLKIAF